MPDLSPIIFESVRWRDREFHFREPLVLRPLWEEGLYVVEDWPWGILAYAPDREKLIWEIGEQVAFAWDAYAMASDEGLAADALRLKQKLRERVECRNSAGKK